MGIFKNNSGTTGGGYTLTGASGGKVKVKAIRREWTTPTTTRGTKRPGKK